MEELALEPTGVRTEGSRRKYSCFEAIFIIGLVTRAVYWRLLCIVDMVSAHFKDPVLVLRSAPCALNAES